VRNLNSQKGFTLIELLIVITIILVLAVAIYFAVKPFQRLADARDNQRVSSTISIRKAIRLFRIDNKGDNPVGLDSTPRMIGTATTGCDVTFSWQGETITTDPACLDLSTQLRPYLYTIPTDPQGGSASKTFYVVRTYGVGNIIDVMAPHLENNSTDTSDPSAPDPSPSPSPSIAPTPSPSPSPSPQVTAGLAIYSDTKKKYCARITVTNSGSVDVSSWQVILNMNESNLASSTHATFTLNNGMYTVTPQASNSHIAVGGSISDVTFCGDKTGTNYQPEIISASGS
jgi:prepilin-type N-terminal cleavage/methylation domain-containing protein